MQPNKDEPLEQAIATLNGLIELAKAHGLGSSALFLDMAKLQLQLDYFGITDEEFGALCDALENGTLTASAVAPRPGSASASAPRGRSAHHAPRLAVSAGEAARARRARPRASQ